MIWLALAVLLGAIGGQLLPISVRRWVWDSADWVRGRFTRSAPATSPRPVTPDEPQTREEVEHAMLNGGGLCPNCGIWGPRHALNCYLANEVSPPPPNKPIGWGKALANIAGAFGKIIAFIARNPMLVLCVAVLAFYLMVVGFRSPFDLFGPSKDELRAELRQTQAALVVTQKVSDIAIEEGERFRGAVHDLSSARDAGREQIQEASSHATRDLLLAWASADRRLCASAGGCGNPGT